MRAISATYVPKTYADLLRCVKQTMFVGQREIDEAWVRTFHESGRLIVSHILLNQRADYGAQVYRGLARDTGASERKLYECAQFYRAFPILRARAKLGWTRCRLLCQVDNESERNALASEALKRDWPSRELERRVRAFNASASGGETADDGDAATLPSCELLTPRRGTPGLHPIVDRGDGPVVDLGFMLYRDLGEGAARLRPDKVGDIVRLTEAGVRKVDDATKAQLFTYAATVRRVIDGDTLVATVMVAPGYSRELKLRLRGLDCPEMSTAAGRAAKRFVDGLIKAGDEIVVSTTKPDKYDRYLADVFIRQSDEGQVTSDEMKPDSAGSTARVSQLLAASKRSEGGSALNSQPAAELFLNNALLEAGHAVRYDGVGPKAE